MQRQYKPLQRLLVFFGFSGIALFFLERVIFLCPETPGSTCTQVINERAVHAPKENVRTAADPRVAATFQRYVASRWEEEWMSWITDNHQFSDGPCARLLQEKGKVDEYLRRNSAMMAGDTVITRDVSQDPVMSKLVYVESNGIEFAKFIEPLVGPLRHPLLCWNIDVYLLNKDFLLLDQAQPPFANDNIIYLDMGASTWNSGGGGPSQNWFYEQYSKRGLNFTAMLMWEAARVDPSQLFGEVPDDVLPIYQYFNVPVAVNRHGQWSVFDAIRTRAPHPDSSYVVVKLDIDNPDVERNIVNALLSDSNLIARIDEFFFEHHTYFTPMNSPWGTRPGDSTLDESYKIFSRMRSLGIRAHSWV